VEIRSRRYSGFIAQQFIRDSQADCTEALAIRERGRRLVAPLVCLTAALALLFAAGPAPARGATYNLGVSIADGGATLSYRAPVGQANDVTITKSGSDFVVTDSGVSSIADAGGCSVSGSTATCPAAGVTLVRVAASDLNDTITVSVPTAANLYGQTGNDTIDSRDGVADLVDCGADSDSTVADVVDSIANCENINVPAPDTSISAGPERPTSSMTAAFEFSSDQPSVTFQCKLDGEDWSSCASPRSYQSLPEGQRLFQVRAINSFGVADPDPATRSWRIDRTAPQVVIDGPNTGANAASFSFGGIDEVTAPDALAFECRLDDGNWVACSSPITYTGLSVGRHTFAVRATDEAGNTAEGGVIFTISSSGGSTPPPPPPPVTLSQPKLLSLVLISGRTIKVSQRRVARVRLNCSGNRTCKGVVTLATAGRVRVSRNRVVKLATRRFRIRPGKAKKVNVRLSRKMYRLVKRLRRVPSIVVVKDRASAGRPRSSTRPVVITAPRKKAGT
jgi:hypothetical protein